MLSRPRERGVARSLSRRVEHRVAHVQRKGELHDGEREHGEQDSDKGELGNSRAPFVADEPAQPRRGRREAAQNPRTRLMAWSNTPLMTAGLVIVIWGLAGPALSGVFDQAISRVLGF